MKAENGRRPHNTDDNLENLEAWIRNLRCGHSARTKYAAQLDDGIAHTFVSYELKNRIPKATGDPP
jgi:hypothetical protein